MTTEEERAAFRAELPVKSGHRMVYDPSRMREVCVDCGATSIEIDDSLAPSCVIVPEGPFREGIVALRCALLKANMNVENLKRHLASAENSCVTIIRDIRAADAHRRELAESLAKLEN